MTTIQFLKNYRIYAAEARYHTANIYLRELESVSNSNTQKLMMIRIIEELAAATEDLSMWLVAVSERNEIKNKKLDLWEILLLTFIRENEEDYTSKNLNKFLILKKPKALLKKLDLFSIDILAKNSNMSISDVEKGLKELLFSIKTSIDNRRVAKGILVRAQAKIKHGMMVNLDAKDINNLWIRDLKLGKGKRKINRYYDTQINVIKAKKMVGTIRGISQSIQLIIDLVLADFEYRLVDGQLKVKAKTKKALLDDLHKPDF